MPIPIAASFDLIADAVKDALKQALTGYAAVTPNALGNVEEISSHVSILRSILLSTCTFVC